MSGIKILAQNKKAYHEYFIETKYEAGMVLCGTEVKSIRQGKLNLKESYVNCYNGEMFVYGMHISPYDHGNIFNEDPLRVRKLLLNRREINKIFIALKEDGYTIIPTSAYLKNGRVKLEIALARGKKLYDKRQTEAEKSAKRDISRTIREHNKY